MIIVTAIQDAAGRVGAITTSGGGTNTLRHRRDGTTAGPATRRRTRGLRARRRGRRACPPGSPHSHGKGSAWPRGLPENRSTPGASVALGTPAVSPRAHAVPSLARGPVAELGQLCALRAVPARGADDGIGGG